MLAEDVLQVHHPGFADRTAFRGVLAVMQCGADQHRVGVTQASERESVRGERLQDLQGVPALQRMSIASRLDHMGSRVVGATDAVDPGSIRTFADPGGHRLVEWAPADADG